MRRSPAARTRTAAVSLLLGSLLLGILPAAAVHAVDPLATTIAVDPIEPVAEGTNAQVTARVSPTTLEVLGGTVRFDLDGFEVVAGVALDGNGVAGASIGPLAFGSHEVVAHFDPPAGGDPIAGSDSAPVAVQALHGATMTWTHAPSPRLDGDPSWFNVTLDTTAIPTGATLTIRDETTDTVLASTAVTATHTFLSSNLVVLALGSHTVRAELTGDPTFVAASLEVTLEVIPDTVIEANVFPLNLTTFYPRADGYRNRLRIWGQCSEYAGCWPKVEIYTDSNQIVRRWIPPAISQNQYKIIWDGRTASGTLLKAGKYRVHHVIRDWKDNVLVVDQWVTLSYRTVRWTTVTVTWSAASYTYADAGLSGWISKSASSYLGGVRLGVRGSGGGWAQIGFRHRLHEGLAYRSMYVLALGRSLNAGNGAMAWCSPQSQAVYITTTFRWYSTPVNSACWPHGVAHPIINISGVQTRTVDVAKVRFTYAYAVWAT